MEAETVPRGNYCLPSEGAIKLLRRRRRGRQGAPSVPAILASIAPGTRALSTR